MPPWGSVPMKGAVMADPPYDGTIHFNRNIITTTDPTTFLSVTDAGQAKRSMYDRRLNKWETFNAYLFNAQFDDGLAAEIQVNPEFGSQDAARIQAQKYCPVIGKLPTVLRTKVETVSIHQGVQLFGGGNKNLVIHTEQADQYERDGILEEALVHEACHTAFDDTLNSNADWIAAQEADKGSFISKYARDYPQREDVAESFLCYLAVRYRSDRISKADADKILEAIPWRIAYFDAQPLMQSIHPIAPPLLKLVKASASSQTPEAWNEGRPQTADRLIEGPNEGYWFWEGGVDDRTPWFSLQLEHRSVVHSLYIRWKGLHHWRGARAMEYKLLSSLDGKSWTETGVDQGRVPFLSKSMAVDALPGWPNPTQFIKVEMSKSYNYFGQYSCCHYVLVRGKRAE
jgi:F5/8 type C domain